MEKQKIIIIFSMVFLLLSLIPVSATLRPDITVTSFNIKEGAIKVGKDFTLELTISNIEPGTCAVNIISSIQANYPFVMNGVSRVKAGDLCDKPFILVDFPMSIDPTAKGGFYQIRVTNDFETSSFLQLSGIDTLNLFVNGTPEMNALIVDSNPIDVYPGDDATLTVNIENDGSFPAQSVISTLSAEKPIEVNWAKSTSSFGMIDSKQSKTMSFSISIPKNAAAQDYPLKLKVEYLDENLESQTKYIDLVLHVKSKAMFDVTDVSPNKFYPNYNGQKLRLQVKNIGTDTAYKLKARVLPMFPFSTDGSVRYIEKLEPGKTVIVELTIDVDKQATIGGYSLDTLLNFEDAQGKALQDTSKVAITVSEKEFYRAVFSDYWFLWIVALVIIIVMIRKAAGKGKKK